MTDLPRAEHRAIRLVAWFEAFKAALVLSAGTGLLTLVHKDAYAVAARLIEHAHLNPASRYPQIFLDAAARLTDSRLLLLAAGAAAYAGFRIVEAWGLLYEKAWAEVLAALSGAIYLPFEVVGWLEKPSWLRAAIFAVNLAIVGLMVHALLARRRARAAPNP